MEHNTIIVEGLIGVGKTTVLSKLNEDTCRAFKEEYDSTKLERHYHDPTPENALAIQLEFYDSINEKIRLAASQDKDAYMDRSLVGILAFTMLNYSLGNLNRWGARELVHRVLDDLEEQLDDNTCIVYLHDDLDKIQDRVKSRSRRSEDNLSVDYQRKLHMWYILVLLEVKRMGYPVYVLNGIDEISTLADHPARHFIDLAKKSDILSDHLVDLKYYLDEYSVDIEDIYEYDKLNTLLSPPPADDLPSSSSTSSSCTIY